MTHASLREIDFVVSKGPVGLHPRPVIGLDGPVQGADLCFDHHVTGEAVNLLAIPEVVARPGTLATTSVDGDAVISAAVVLLRAVGEEAAVRDAWPTLHEACYYCDLLGASGRYPEAEAAGLGLHCWLKERGFALREVLGSEHDGPMKPAPSGPTEDATAAALSAVYRSLTLALVQAIRRRAIPGDLRYLERLPPMETESRRAITAIEGRVTVLEPSCYLDPLAYYRVVTTDLAVIAGPARDGARPYTVGVHPSAYERIDLRPVLAALAAQEPGWGGRREVGGAPKPDGSRIPLERLVEILNDGAAT